MLTMPQIDPHSHYREFAIEDRTKRWRVNETSPYHWAAYYDEGPEGEIVDIYSATLEDLHTQIDIYWDIKESKGI